MIKKFLILIILINLINITELNASTGLLKSASIIECDGELYGFHSSDNHYHHAEKTEDGKYKAKGETLGSNWTCPGIIKNPNENKILEKTSATFVKCVDGDTAVFNIDEKETKFRFLGIDTPETVHPTKGQEAYGKNASEYTCNKLKNATIIEIEYEDEKLDKYGRSLGWIWTDGTLLQDELIKLGYAEVAYIYGNYKYTTSLCETQKNAIQNNLGIWGNTNKKEGYCSTLRTVERNINTSPITNNDKEKEEKNYTKETIGTLTLAILLIIIKIKKK